MFLRERNRPLLELAEIQLLVGYREQIVVAVLDAPSGTGAEAIMLTGLHAGIPALNDRLKLLGLGVCIIEDQPLPLDDRAFGAMRLLLVLRIERAGAPGYLPLP